ncbi:uncharacterized protein LOC115444759 [Manduca sexta]|uniref:Shavenoid isoform B-like N-terminal domain-containing protein n=1 Tax=Manduca sexta TaxID=7130 RepID=A0A921Z7L4_MANSE|nr:uncharacterized protein LOC115444759 [Manduca sexta]KAG6452004.1 hypothetical protein O3G_MSEX007425 [Manduca sexta]
MALLLVLVVTVGLTFASNSVGEMALANVTRLATGDLFSLIGSDCGPTRCMEVSHGTALAAMSGDGNACTCRCRRDTPTFREDQRVCVNNVDECLMASFGRGEAKPQIPFVFLPLKGQIIYPSKEIVFTDVEDAICAVTSAQYLSSSGWVTLRDLMDNDVPFGLYRDEGSTFLQWRGSAALHARLEGRLVAVHVLCSASSTSRLATSCAAFRIAGASQNGLLDVRSIPFHSGEVMPTESSAQNQGLSVLESLAIGVCVLMLIFIYAAGIIFYIHYKQRQKRKRKDPEQNMSISGSSDIGTSLESRIDMNNVMLKTNPLLKLNGLGSDFFSSDTGFSDASEHTEDTIDKSPGNSHKFQKMNSSVISALVHSRRKKPSRPSLRNVSSSDRFHEGFHRRAVSPDTLERAPHSDLSIVDCSVENNVANNRQLASHGETVLRKKLYFNPIFFETELLKNPPPAAIEFLMKIREVMSIAKEKMTSKRFIPILKDIPEEDLYHTLDLGWDIPCARRGRRFSAISLKQENSRRAVHCGGCPGCDSNVRPQKAVALTRSNSCKSCVSDDYKQRIVRKWLDEVPTPSSTKKPIKSVAKTSGTYIAIQSKAKEEVRPKSAEPIRNEDTKPKIKEMVLLEQCMKNPIKEIVVPKELKPKPEVKIISKPIPIKENKSIEDKKPPKPTISEPKPISPTTKEKKSSQSHTSRRIRKKLPPPPPPPVNQAEVPTSEEGEPVSAEVKVKMEAVLQEFNYCKRAEPMELEEVKMETISPIAPRIVIPVIAADSTYFSDDNTLRQSRKKDSFFSSENGMEYDSLERSLMRRRRFSLACGPELIRNEYFNSDQSLAKCERLTSSWRDVKKAVEEDSGLIKQKITPPEHRRQSISEVFIEAPEPLYDNISNPGPLTIQVRGSPIENRRNSNEDFDPDTLDRKPKHDVKKRVEKILLKSAGSFKYKSTSSESEPTKKSPDFAITRKIGNLRQIYEAKAKAQEEEAKMYKRRGSVPYGAQDMPAFIRPVKTPDLIKHIEGLKDPKPPVPPKSRRGPDLSPKFSSSTRESPPGERRRGSEDRDRFPLYTRAENLNARRSGRRSARTRSRRTDLRKLYRTEDSGYMSTDSNESKRRANYLMQLKPKLVMPEIAPMPTVRTVIKTSVVQAESDTDELESLCDGRSESGGESVETDSVFFGNFDDSKELLAELGISTFDPKKLQTHEQIDSGFMGETNIILSGDSDSEHRSVISIVTGHDGRASSASIARLDDTPYMHTIEC